MPQSILPVPFDWIDIPAGKVTFYHHRRDAVLTFDVSGFRISKYPITVAQYEVFIRAMGYKEKRYWTNKSWEWRKSEDITLPKFWNEDRFKNFFAPDHPIVFVSWYESLAFCQWLSDKTGKTILLPTEQQWHRAAQADTKWVYPWGDEFDANLCNSSVVRQSKVTTPVISYPGGASPYSVLDMIGNICEWTLTNYDNPDDNDLDEVFYRALRGGDWHEVDEEVLTISSRLRLSPTTRDYRDGFRIVCL